MLVASAFRGPWGETSFDTKSDLAVSPGEFLSRSLHLWNGQASFGELQNQAYGYLFPQGSFAWVGELLGLPAWVVQRLWVAVVLVVAYEGVRRLFLALPGHGPWPSRSGAAVLAGLVYAAAPRVGGIAGVLSSEVTPPALLPWAVLAVVSHATGRVSARTAGLAVGAAFLGMGGVNAVAVIACLPLVVLSIVGTVPAGSRRPIAAWTTLGVGAAVLWWMGPLVLLGRYSPPFLDFIETSDATTAPLGWANVSRGAVHWVAFTSTGTASSLPGAFGLHATVVGLLLTWVVAITALLGLTHHGMPYRRMLVSSACVGVIALTIGHAGALEGPLSGTVRWLLDGPLAMLRNVHKIDPLVRLPLALGFGHAVLVLMAWAPGRRSSHGSGRPRRHQHLLTRALAVGLAVIAVSPLAVAPSRADGWREFPDAWRQATQYIESNRPTGTTLVLPATSFGEQTWGRTVDEPIQSVARTSWVSRSQVPLTPSQTIRFLDAVIARTEDPGGSGSLADVLARAGVRTIVVRHDLVRAVIDPEVTRRVVQALAAAPGISRVTTFGAADDTRVEVYGVDRHAPAVEAVEVDSLAWVRGGAEDVVAAVEAGTLDPGRPAVMVGDAGPLAPGREAGAPDVVGDGLARRERAFGLVRESIGPVLGPDIPFTTSRPVHDYPGTPATPLAVSEYDGIAGVAASSSTAQAESVGPVRPDQSAWASIDGDVRTAWRSDVFSSPLDQWWEVDLGEPRPVGALDLLAGVNPFDGVPIRRVVVTTDDGQRVPVSVHPETGEATALLSGSVISRIRVSVVAVAGAWSRGSVGLLEIGIPGVVPARRVVVPPAAAGADTAFVFRTSPSRRACTVVDGLPFCASDAVRGQEEAGGISRRFTLDEPSTVRPTAQVRAVAGPSTALLFDPLGDALTVHADSVLGEDPAVVGAFAMDGDARSHWLAQPLARSATLTLSTDRPAVVSALSVQASRSVATRPTGAVVSNGTSSREVSLVGGAATFAPLEGQEFTVRFVVDAATVLTAPLGVGELVVSGLEDRVYQPDLASATGAECGLGPQLVIDGRAYDTRVEGTLLEVRDGLPLRATVCDGPTQLGRGEHVLAWRPSDRFELTMVSLDPVGSGGVTPIVRRSASMIEVGPSRRVVDLGPGGDAVLRIAQNFNAGWRAELDGTTLAPIRVDGWQQGFVAPAGAGGAVQLVFEPDSAYRRSLLVGAVVALLLVLVSMASGALELRVRSDRVGAGPPDVSPPRPEVCALEQDRCPARWWYGGFAAGCALFGGVAAVVGALAWASPALRSRARQVASAGLVSGAVGQLLWVMNGGSAVSSPVVVDLLVGASVTVLVAGAWCVPGPWERTGGRTDEY